MSLLANLFNIVLQVLFDEIYYTRREIKKYTVCERKTRITLFIYHIFIFAELANINIPETNKLF
jgi:hypothetical protein